MNQQSKQTKSKLKTKKSEQKEKRYYAQDFLPITDIINGLIITDDGRYVKIIEIEPINFSLRSHKERNSIIDDFFRWCKTCPVRVQFKSITTTIDTSELENNIIRQCMPDTRAEHCNETILARRNEYLQHIEYLNNHEAIRRRFFLILEYRPARIDAMREKIGMKSPENLEAIRKTMEMLKNEFANRMAQAGNTVYYHEDETLFHVEFLYNMLNRKSSKTDNFYMREQRIISDMMQYYNISEDEAYERLNVVDLVAPRGIDMTHVEYVVADGIYYAYLYIQPNTYPSSVYAGWYDLLQRGDGIDIDIYSVKQDRNKVRQNIKYTKNFKTYLANNQTDENQEQTITSLTASNLIRQKLKEGQDLFDVMTLITVTAPTKAKLEEKVYNLTKQMEEDDIKLIRIYARCEAAFKMSLPLLQLDQALFKLGKRNFLTESLAAAYFFTAFEVYDPTGYLVGINQANSSLAVINNFNTNKYKNANIAIIGTSGAGKTFTEQLLGRHMRLTGLQTIYILPIKGYEYYRGCEAIDGSYIKLAPYSTQCINILAITPTDAPDLEIMQELGFATENLLTEKITQLCTFVNLLMKGEEMTNVEQPLFEEVLLRLYNRFGMTQDNESIWTDHTHTKIKPQPIFSDLAEELAQVPELERISIIIRPFVSGTCKSMNGQTNIDLNNRYLVFDVSEAGDALLPAFMFIALDCAYSIVKKNKLINNVIFLDEIWKLMINPQSAQFVLELVKCIRGYGGAAIVATQELQDLKNTGAVGRSILNNTKIKFILQLEDDDAEAVQKLFRLTDNEIKKIKKFKKGGCLMITNGDKVQIDIRACQKEIDDFSTDTATMTRIVRQLKQERLQQEEQQAETHEPYEDEVEDEVAMDSEDEVEHETEVAIEY